MLGWGCLSSTCHKDHSVSTGDSLSFVFDYSMVDVNSSILDFISSDIETLQFESIDQALFANLNRILLLDTFIIAHSWDQHKVSVFSAGNGRYLGDVGSEGHGPGDFLSARDISINRQSHEIHVLDYRKIHVYDIRTRGFVRTLEVDFDGNITYNPMSFCLVGPDDYVFWNESPDSWIPESIDASYLIHWDGDNYRYFVPFSGTKDVLSIRFTNARNGKCLIRPPLGDFRIMEWNSGSVRFKYSLEVPSLVPKDKISIEDKASIGDRDLRDYETQIVQVFEVSNYVYVVFEGKGGRIYQGLLDTSGGARFWEYTVDLDFPHVLHSDGQNLYGVLSPDRILDRYRQREKSEKYSNLFYSKLDLNTIEELDNLILFKFTFR